jgi:hypothetical protein
MIEKATAAAGAMWVMDWKSTGARPMASLWSWGVVPAWEVPDMCPLLAALTRSANVSPPVKLGELRVVA